MLYSTELHPRLADFDVDMIHDDDDTAATWRTQELLLISLDYFYLFILMQVDCHDNMKQVETNVNM